MARRSPPSSSTPSGTSARGGTRERMLDSAIALLRVRSAAGVTIDAVLAHSGAPRGSVYHHFPAGRDQIVAEAVDIAGRHIAEIISAEPGEPADPSDVVRRLCDFWERTLRHNDYLAGCPVAALTVDVQADDASASRLVADIFATWHTQLRAVLLAAGVEQARAGRLARLVIAAAEGAVLLSRADRSTGPLREVSTELCQLLDAAVG